MSIEFESLPRRTQRAWADVGGLSCLAAERPTLEDAGEFNQVVLCDEAILRVPRSEEPLARAALEYESEVSFLLHDSGYVDSPLAIPRLLDVNYCEPPYYMIFTRLPGESLDKDVIRQLSTEEKAAFGSKIGAFIAWYAATLDINIVERHIRETRVRLPDRASKASQYARLVIEAADIDYVLGDLLLDNLERYKRYSSEGLLDPRIVGHDDLHLGNLLFNRQTKRLDGVLDFGSTKPSSPERELRHAASLGPEVLEAAIHAYEAATNSKVARELVDFWAVLQVSTVFAYRLLQGDPQRIKASREDMQVLRPQNDWSQAFIVA